MFALKWSHNSALAQCLTLYMLYLQLRSAPEIRESARQLVRISVSHALMKVVHDLWWLKRVMPHRVEVLAALKSRVSPSWEEQPLTLTLPLPTSRLAASVKTSPSIAKSDCVTGRNGLDVPWMHNLSQPLKYVIPPWPSSYLL